MRSHIVMRRLPAAILASVASHAVALAWIVCDGTVLAVPLRDRPAAVAPADPPVNPPPGTPPPEPIAIVLLETHDEPAEAQPRTPNAADAASASSASRADRR